MSRISGDLWRILAMVAVVTIHTAGPSEWVFLKQGVWLSEGGLAVALSQLARFSVPLFIVMSGFGLAASEAARGIDRWSWSATRAFWVRRGERVLLPYLVWSLGTLVYMGRLSTDLGSISWSDLGYALLSGGADYHLYFIAFLLQGYLVWPLLRRPSWTLVIVLLLVQVYFASPTHVLHPSRVSVPGWVFVHWAGYFALGARLTMIGASTGHARWAWLTWSGTGIAVLMEYGYWAGHLPDPGWFNHFSRYVVIAFSLATVWLWWATAASVADHLRSHAGRLQRGAAITFCVYFIHVWVLRWFTPLDLGFVGTLILVLPSAFGIAWLLDLCLAGRWARWPRRCLGL